MYPKAFFEAVCAGISAQKKVDRMGLRAEPVMSIDEMLLVVSEVSEATKDFNTSKELHEEVEQCNWDDMVAFDDQSGASFKPILVRRASVEEIQ